MRRAERVRRPLLRSDVQTAWITSAALLLAVFVPGVFLYAYAAEESLEQFDRWFEYAISVVARDVEEGGAAAIHSEDSRGLLPNADAAVRVRGVDGEILAERGRWPAADEQIRARLHDGKERRRDLTVAWWIRHARWMVGDRALSSGATVEIALPLRSFASVNAKIRTRIAAGAVISALAVLAIGLAATWRAFLPLRRATAQLREVDTGSLGVRLPSRATGDPIDLHAETLNSVLARIDAGFARLRAFSSDAAHELRTPLNRITNVTEVALLEGGEKDLHAALEAVHHTTEELTRTVHALLLLAEIDERRFALQPRAISLAPWIEQHVEAYAPSFEEAGVELVAKSEAIEIEGDRVLLDRIIANLLDNALSHAPSGSRVEIHAARREGGVAIAVDDAGPASPSPTASGYSIASPGCPGRRRRGMGSGSRSRARSRSCTAACCARRSRRWAARASSSGSRSAMCPPPAEGS
jgi:signal transduction histidine kinase